MLFQGYVVGIRDSPSTISWFVTFHEGVPKTTPGNDLAKIFETRASAQVAARHCTLSTGNVWSVFSLNDFIRLTKTYERGSLI